MIVEAQTSTRQAPAGRLENWFSERVGGGEIFWGHVYGDAQGRFKDGTWIHTSRVINVNFDTGFLLTCNSVYQLGERAPHTIGARSATAEDLQFKGVWPDHQPDEPEDWENWQIILRGTQAGDTLEDPEEILRALQRAGLWLIRAPQ